MDIRLFLVEDNEEMRMAYELLIEDEPDLALCGMATTAQEALGMISGAEPDIVIVDVSLPDMSGIELVRQLKARQPALTVLVISGHDEALYVRDAVQAGATGYLIKHQVVEELSDAVRQVLQGTPYFSDHVRRHLN